MVDVSAENYDGNGALRPQHAPGHADELMHAL
jgi:hypothetical protein